MNTRIVYVLQMLISNGQLEKLLFLQFYIYYTYNFENENSAKEKNVKIFELCIANFFIRKKMVLRVWIIFFCSLISSQVFITSFHALAEVVVLLLGLTWNGHFVGPFLMWTN